MVALRSPCFSHRKPAWGLPGWGGGVLDGGGADCGSGGLGESAAAASQRSPLSSWGISEGPWAAARKEAPLLLP